MFVASSVMEYLSVSSNRNLNEILTKSQTKGFDPFQDRPDATKKTRMSNESRERKNMLMTIFSQNSKTFKKNAHLKNLFR